MIHQIHIAGAKRSGKTTLGTGLVDWLQTYGISSTLVDVDQVRAEIFGELIEVPDSAESMQKHLVTIRAMYSSIIPRLLAVKGSPVVVAGHSRRDQYDEMVSLATKCGSTLTIFVVEPPSLAEAAERARSMSSEDRSDMRDFTDPRIQRSFIDSAERVATLYRSLDDPRIHWIKQGSSREMLVQAWNALNL